MRALRPLEKLAGEMLHLPVTGLDISDRSVKFIRFRKSGRKLAVEAEGNAPLKEGIISGGEIKDPEALAAILKTLRLGARGKFVVTSLPEEKSFLRILQLPKVKRETLRDALRWELEGNIPLAPEDVYFDYEVIRENEARDHFDVLTVAFPRAIVDSYAAALQSAGFSPIALELESQSMARALIDHEHPEEPVILADIGASRTSLVLLEETSIALTSTIPLSGDTLNQAVAAVLGIGQKEAEEVKKRTGLTETEYKGAVAKALRDALAPLVDELEKHLEFYRDRLARHHSMPSDVAKIVVTGGEASLIGLDAYLARVLHKPILLGDPFLMLSKHLLSTPPAFPRNRALQFSAAVGLALRDVDF